MTAGWWWYILLSGAGEAMNGIREQLDSVISTVISALTPGEAEQLMRLMQKIYALLSSPGPVQEQGLGAKVLP